MMERVGTPGERNGQAPVGVARDQAVESPVPPGEERDCAEARAYGAAFAKALGPGSPTWEAMGPLVRHGWASRHDQVCDARHDWRLSWPAVRDGWREAGGAFDPPPPATTTEMPAAELILPESGAHVFDAFGEPAGRVKGVRDSDFLLGRPLARDVYVPFSAIRWPGQRSLRIGVANAQLGTLGWERPKLFGLFGGNPAPGTGREPDSAFRLALTRSTAPNHHLRGLQRQWRRPR
jgi:hypothetical protein